MSPHFTIHHIYFKHNQIYGSCGPNVCFRSGNLGDHKLRNIDIGARVVRAWYSAMMARQIYTNIYMLLNMNLAIHFCLIKSTFY